MQLVALRIRMVRETGGHGVLVIPESDVQESEIYACKEDFRGHGYQLHFGSRTSLSEAGSQGRRIAMTVKYPTEAYELALLGSDLLALAKSGRWTERLTPVQDGSAFIVVAGLYGFYGASSATGSDAGTISEKPVNRRGRGTVPSSDDEPNSSEVVK